MNVVAAVKSILDVGVVMVPRLAAITSVAVQSNWMRVAYAGDQERSTAVAMG